MSATFLFFAVAMQFTTEAQSPDPSQAVGDALAYRMNGRELTALQPVLSEAKDLPDSLVVTPGRYWFAGNLFALEAPGLYRFLKMGTQNEQRIVDNGDVSAFMSALAWIHIHGTSDDALDLTTLELAARQRKLVSTCGPIAQLAENILLSRGYQARLVATLSAPPYNDYDNGHTLIEVYRVDLRKWVVYDLDNNVFFQDGANPLSIAEFVERAQSDKYTIVNLAGDSGLSFPASPQGYDYSFYAEYNTGTEAALRKWYSRVARVALIPEQGQYYFSDETLREALEGYAATYRYLSTAEFQRRFYSPAATKPSNQ